jgi:hypothetical protein
MSLRAVKKIRDDRSAGGNPKELHVAHLSRREKQLVAPFAGPGGVRKLQRAINALAVVARDSKWTVAKKKRVAQALRDGANEIFPADNHAQAPGSPDVTPLERRERERKRLTDASHTRITKKSGIPKYPQADPATEPGCELVPFFPDGISAEDEKYVLLDARDPFEFLRRARERGIHFGLENSDPFQRRPHALEENYTPDIAAEIDEKNRCVQRDNTEDILAEYEAIADASARRRFLLQNKKAIHRARASVAKRYNFEHKLNLEERRKWKWVKTDDGYAFKAVPPTSAR